jgi:hypothetical protein
LKVAKKKKKKRCTGREIPLKSLDFSPERWRPKGSDTFSNYIQFFNNRLSTVNSISDKLSFRNKGERKPFSDQGKLREFVTCRPTFKV